MPWYFYLAFKQLFPSGRVLSFFTVVSVMGVMLGVALLLIVQTVMNGFSHELRSKIVEASGHINVVSSEILRDYDGLVEELNNVPGVRWSVPVAQGQVLMNFENRPMVPNVHAVDVNVAEEMEYLERFLLMGAKSEDLFDDSVFISRGLARSLGLRPGDVVDVYSPMLLQRLERNEIILPRELKVAGIFSTDWHEIDEATIIVTLRMMQDLYGLGEGAHAISLRLEDHLDSFAMARELERTLFADRDLRAISWQEQNESFLWILNLEKNVMLFLLLFIVVVAAFSIASSLLINVIRKTREIGLLGSLGGRPWEIGVTFCFQGFFLGVAGTAAGLAVGSLIITFRNQIIGIFARLTGAEDSLQQYYHFTFVPARYEFSDFVIIGVCAIIISTLAGLIPALRAARLRPVEAFRHG
ncbi:MAG: ABC transporter permease [Opitutales bacterium]|nr:ABC transporter permease [Opitutales bacterium]